MMEMSDKIIEKIKIELNEFRFQEKYIKNNISFSERQEYIANEAVHSIRVILKLLNIV